MPLKLSHGMGAWITDFRKSDAPQFKGKSDEKKREMAIAAKLQADDASKNEEVEQMDESFDPSEIASNPRMYSADSAKKAYYHKKASESDKQSLARHLDRYHGNKEWRKPVKEETGLEEQAPVAPVPDKKYIKGTPEHKAYMATKKPRTGHPTNEEAELEEGMQQTLRKVVPGYAKKQINKKMDAQKFGRTDVDKDANFYRYKKVMDKLKKEEVMDEEMTPAQKAARLALIRKTAAKLNKRAERDAKENYVSHAQRKAVWASRADGGKGHPDNKKKNESVKNEAAEYDSGWKKSPKDRKDQYGNPVKAKNVPKQLAKMGMKQHDKDDKKKNENVEEGGLWANIHAKRKRIKNGSGERMRKPGSKGAPTNKDFKDAQESVQYKTFFELREAAKCYDDDDKEEKESKGYKPGWMLKADPKLKSKVDAAKAKHKEFKKLVGTKKESVEHIEEDMKSAAKEMHGYASKHGGMDKADFHKAAKHMETGNHKALHSLVKKLDSDPRDKILTTLHKHGNDIKRYGYSTEAVEQVDELSQNTLRQYHGKAASDFRKKKDQLSKGTLSTADHKKGQNRLQGLNRAANKMESDASWEKAQEKEKEKKLTNKDQKTLSQLRALMNKEKK